MHEQVGLEGDQARHLAGRCVAGEHDAPAAPRLAHDLVGVDAVDGLALLEAAEVRPRLDAELASALGVERPRARVLDQRVAERADAVVGLVCGDPVAVALDLLVAGSSSYSSTGNPTRPMIGRSAPNRRAQARRAVDAQRPLALAQPERLEHAGQAEHVIGVEVGDEDVLELNQPVDRTSWRWVPSPQSNSRRSPPRRTSVAGRPRALGAEPAVPTKRRRGPWPYRISGTRSTSPRPAPAPSCAQGPVGALLGCRG